LIEAELPANVIDARLRHAQEIIEELLKPVVYFLFLFMLSTIHFLFETISYYFPTFFFITAYIGASSFSDMRVHLVGYSLNMFPNVASKDSVVLCGLYQLVPPRTKRSGILISAFLISQNSTFKPCSLSTNLYQQLHMQPGTYILQ
jgi:hypothetical protein